MCTIEYFPKRKVPTKWKKLLYLTGQQHNDRFFIQHNITFPFILKLLHEENDGEDHFWRDFFVQTGGYNFILGVTKSKESLYGFERDFTNLIKNSLILKCLFQNLLNMLNFLRSS